VSSPGPGHKLTSLALAVLIVLPWIVFVLRTATGGTSVASTPRPKWAHVLVLTAGRVAGTTQGAADAPGASQLTDRAVFVPSAKSPSLSTAAAAASLWTGRWPLHHGVTSNALALAPDTWTLAAAARASGARTAAFTAEPFVDATGIGGFETAAAEPGLDARALAERARRWLARTPGRFVLWLHLEDAGRGARELLDLAASMHRILETDGRALDTATLVTALRGSQAPAERPPSAPFTVPLWLAMPARVRSGRVGVGTPSLVDVADALRTLLALPPPPADGPGLQSRSGAAAVLQGGSATPQHLLLGPDDFVYLDPAGWLRGSGPPPASLERATFEAEPESLRDLLARRYAKFRERTAPSAANATAALPAPDVAGFESWSR